MTLYIGLMSGTSMDGIDAALVEMSSNTLICGITKKYSDELRQALEGLINGQNLSLGLICQLNTRIGREFALTVQELLQESRVSPREIRAIGSHGQTVCHDATASIPYTLQLGCAHTISLLTGINVVADFRTKDLVNGGQGAPFAPLYHQELFKGIDQNIALVNIGGIANITFICPNQMTKGWDAGPGNCLMDAWIYLHQGKMFDANGSWARQGNVLQPLLVKLLDDPFFKQSPPKSIGKEYFSITWLEQYLEKEYKPVDVQATLLALTAHSIAGVLLSHSIRVTKLYLCGGGTHNIQLQETLAELIPAIQVNSIADAGFSPDYLEAMMCAWLASQTINQVPVNLSAITGSKGAEILGAVYNSV